jgi:hypothetical protein
MIQFFIPQPKEKSAYKSMGKKFHSKICSQGMIKNKLGKSFDDDWISEIIEFNKKK